MQPLAGCLTHHFLRPVSGRPIVCHDGKDTNFIAYLQANRNIFYNGGNATQCLLPTAARHPILQANVADAATAAGHRPNRNQKPRNQPLAEALGIGPQHLPFGKPKRAVRQCKNGRFAGQYNKREPSHSRAATMQALPSPVPLPPRSGTGPAIPTKSDMAENARRNKTGPATALQPTNFHARHNSHGRHTLPMPRDWYGKKPPHCGKQPLVAWQKRLHNGKKRFARV